MKIRFIDLFFIIIGISVGVILSLQIRSKPVRFGSSQIDQMEVQKDLLETFSLEQDELRKELDAIQIKLSEAKDIIEKRSSKQTLKTINHLKELTGLTSVSESGIRITITDNPSVTRINFSSLSEDFIQTTDLRDLVNTLFLKDAKAISINGKRVMPLTPLTSVFDTILIDNIQITPPFVIEAIGNEEELQSALQYLNKKRKIQIFVDTVPDLTINPLQTMRPVKFLSLKK